MPEDQIEMNPGAPRLEVKHQRADESGFDRWLSKEKQVALKKGDKVQLIVTIDHGPRYVYLYWYNADGEPERLWPRDEDIENQPLVSSIRTPKMDDTERWHTIDNDPGAELAFVAVRSTPLDADELKRLEQQVAYSRGANQLKEVFHFASEDQKFKERFIDRGLAENRGFSGTTTSRSSPLDKQFEKALTETFKFESYHGVVIPHVRVKTPARD